MKKALKWMGIIIGGFILLMIVVAVVGGGGNKGGSQTAQNVASQSGTSAASTAAQSSSKPTATPMPSVGQTAAKGNWEIMLEKVERSKALQDITNKDVAPQGEFLVVLASAKNVGKETYSLNSWDFNVIAPGDIKYKLASQLMLKDVQGYKTVWLSQQVQPNLSQKIRLIFDVPPVARGLKWDVAGIQFAIPD